MPRFGSGRSVCFGSVSRSQCYSQGGAAETLSPRPVEIFAIAAQAIGSGSRPSVGARYFLRFGAPGVVVVDAIGYRLCRLFYPEERRCGRHGCPFFRAGPALIPRNRRFDPCRCAVSIGLRGASRQRTHFLPLRSGETSAGLPMFAADAARRASHRDVASTRCPTSMRPVSSQETTSIPHRMEVGRKGALCRRGPLHFNRVSIVSGSQRFRRVSESATTHAAPISARFSAFSDQFAWLDGSATHCHGHHTEGVDAPAENHSGSSSGHDFPSSVGFGSAGRMRSATGVQVADVVSIRRQDEIVASQFLYSRRSCHFFCKCVQRSHASQVGAGWTLQKNNKGPDDESPASLDVRRSGCGMPLQQSNTA